LQNQRGIERGSISGVKDPLDTQLWDISEKSEERVTTSHDNIHDGRVILLTEMNIWKSGKIFTKFIDRSNTQNSR